MTIGEKFREQIEMEQNNIPLKPLISVIVPIYNVEKYVRKCLDSLVNQTMKQIEVICIDDGSTDESGRIADEFMKVDGFPLFRVIHTKNRGLSAARNLGIDEAQAEWLMFVDSDDWVDERFCEIPYRAAVENDCDLVIFGRYLTKENGRIKREKKRVIPTGLIDHETAIDVGWPAAWNKMYKKELFMNVRYPEGRVYEEKLTTHRLVYEADSIVNTSNPLYYYRTRRSGGITQNTSFDEEWIVAGKKQYDDLVDYGYPEKKARTELWRVALKCYGRAETEDSPVYTYAERYLSEIEGFPAEFSAREKLMLAFYKVDRHLYRFLYKTVKRWLAENIEGKES